VYANLCNTPVLPRIGIETAGVGTRHNMAIELTKEIGIGASRWSQKTQRKLHIFPAARVHGSPEGECGFLQK